MFYIYMYRMYEAATVYTFLKIINCYFYSKY